LNRVAKRYAKALFEFAQEQKLLPEVHADLQHIRELIETSPEFDRLLTNPLITESEKSRMIRPIFEGKINTITVNFLELLSEKRRLEYLSDVIDSFEHFLLEYENKVKGEVISAIPLSDDQMNAIKTHVEGLIGKNLLLQEKVDKQLLGGFVVRVQDMVIDNSIRAQLEKLRERLASR